MQEGAPDPGLYDYHPYNARPKITWPVGKTCAVWVAPNLEYYEIDPPIHPKRNPWPHPAPSVIGYSHRDHSNRVSHWRMADVMSKHGFPGSVSLSVALCQHHPEVVADANDRGWEFFSHGIYNTRYSYDMTEAQERAIIEDSIQTVEDATGQRIRGWLAPALTHTSRTLDLLAEYVVGQRGVRLNLRCCLGGRPDSVGYDGIRGDVVHAILRFEVAQDPHKDPGGCLWGALLPRPRPTADRLVLGVALREGASQMPRVA